MISLESATNHAPASPFHAPGIQYAWDSTSLGWFKECPRKYFYSMIEGYRSRGESVHLRFGIHYHSALEHFDHEIARGQPHEDALRATVFKLLVDTWDAETSSPWTPDHNLKTRANLVRSVVWYIEHFREDAARTLILANGKAAVELSFRFSVDDDLMLSGHLDRVVDFMGGQYVMDRKTTTITPGQYYFNQYTPDNQMSLYSYAGQVILQSPIRGVIIDAVQIAVGFSRFERGFAHRTPDQLDEWLADTRAHVRYAHSLGERMRDADPAAAWPMNDKSCHKFGGCPFLSVCSRDARVRKTFLESDFVRDPWNPLIPR